MSQRSTSPLKRSTVRRTLKRFWDVTRTQPLIVFLSVFSSAGYIFLLTFANTYVMALIVDRVQAGPVAGDQVFEVFGPYILALVLVNLVGQILSKLQDYTVYKLEIAGNYHLARLCFDTLSNQSMTFHTSRFGGSLVSQTSRFMSGYTGLVDVTVYSLIPTITSVVCTVAALAPVVPTFTVILVCIMAVYIAFVWLMYKRIMPLSAATSAAQNKLSGVLSDAVTNILAVKTCGREDFERNLFDTADRAARDAETVSMHAMMQRNFTTSGLIVITMAVVSVFVAGGNAWFGISAGALVMIFTYTYNLTMRLNYVSSMMQRINRALGDAAEMTRVLDEPRLVADDENAPELKVSEGAIDFEHLSFAYRDAAAGESVFDDLTLHVAAGQRVGLVGKSGSGKTTLTKLLLRLDDVQGGRVLVDGQDVSRCTQQSLRRQVAYVPQEALLFHRSIRENIAYGRPDATDEQIREAARLANALEFIDRLPRGFDTMVGERGVKLSGGQRQRVAIARAILTDAPILVLDEATSALDSESEALVQEALENLMRGRTSIVVAHRLSTVAALDRIVVLADGEIVEDGTHAQLVEAGGEYASLWGRQTGAFLEAQRPHTWDNRAHRFVMPPIRGVVMPRETNAAKRERAVEVCERLNRRYGPVECFLDHENPFRLLIAVLLSAQTTDAQVNKVTPKLFAQWPTPEAMAGASVVDVADTIKSLGFYKSKAKHAVEAAQMIVADYGGEVPADMKELVKLPGVGRKTANIVLNVGFGIVEGIAVDTHVNRIAHRLMLSPKTHAKEPLKTEQDLLKILPHEYWESVNHQWITFGREICDARKPKCDECPLADLCPSVRVAG